jgi:hypothetical protein
LLTLKNIFRIANKIFGPILLLVLSYSIYKQVSNQHQLQQAFEAILSFSIYKVLILIVVFLLMLFSFYIESIKWKILVAPFQNITVLQATKHIFTGQAFAFTSINDLGDFVGRAAHFKENRVKIGALNIVATYSQLLVIIGIGLIGWAYNFIFLIQYFKLSFLLFSIAFVGGASLFFICFFGYFYQQKFIALIQKINWLLWVSKNLEMVHQVKIGVLTKLLLYSFFKYVVYTVQYLLVLYLFGVDGSLINITSLIAILLLAITIIPSIAFAELGIRGKLALVLFGILTSNHLSILIATLLIWFINRVIPAIIGLFFTSTIKLKH